MKYGQNDNVDICVNREDYSIAQTLKTEEEKEYLYVQLKTAAESGWDFSTRWYIHNATNNGEYTFL